MSENEIKICGVPASSPLQVKFPINTPVAVVMGHSLPKWPMTNNKLFPEIRYVHCLNAELITSCLEDLGQIKMLLFVKL